MKNLSFEHLLSGKEITNQDFKNIMSIAEDMKIKPNKYKDALSGEKIAMIFDKPSLRTRF